MGLCNSQGIFQERMNKLFQDFWICESLYRWFINNYKSTYENHIDAVEKFLSRLENEGLKINATKSFFAQTQLEYLGYWNTRKGIQPLPNKVEAISNWDTPRKNKNYKASSAW